MTVSAYKTQLKNQIKVLEKFKPGTCVEFTDALYSILPSIDLEKMRYNEEHTKTKYRAVDEDGHFAEWGNHIIEHDSIERLANGIAYYYHRSKFYLKVKDSKSNTWRDPTKYESKMFDKELDDAFRLDEYH